jgi:hypothetical protein
VDSSQSERESTSSDGDSLDRWFLDGSTHGSPASRPKASASCSHQQGIGSHIQEQTRSSDRTHAASFGSRSRPAESGCDRSTMRTQDQTRIPRVPAWSPEHPAQQIGTSSDGSRAPACSSAPAGSARIHPSRIRARLVGQEGSDSRSASRGIADEGSRRPIPSRKIRFPSSGPTRLDRSIRLIPWVPNGTADKARLLRWLVLTDSSRQKRSQ